MAEKPTKAQRQQQEQRQAQERQRAQSDQEKKERDASERRAKMKPHVGAAQDQMKQQSSQARQYLEKIKVRLVDGTLTEDELAELETQLPRDEKGDKEAEAREAKQEQPQDRPLRPAEISAPRPEMQKAQDRVGRMIDNCLSQMDQQNKRLASGELSEDETMENRAAYQDMLNKLERLASGRNPAGA